MLGGGGGGGSLGFHLVAKLPRVMSGFALLTAPPVQSDFCEIWGGFSGPAFSIKHNGEQNMAYRV